MQDQAPAATISRLITYLRTVTRLESEGVARTSSEALAEATNVSAFQVRKDLAYFGTFGTRGSGYDVATVGLRLREILGVTGVYNVAIVGMGRLGEAITEYPAWGEYGFSVGAMFDVDPDKIGLAIAGIEVSPMARLGEVVRERDIEMALITVPAGAAQGVADDLVAAGIRAMLNFAPAVLTVPAGVMVEPVDFLAGLKRLAYHLRGMPALRHGQRQQAA